MNLNENIVKWIFYSITILICITISITCIVKLNTLKRQRNAEFEQLQETNKRHEGFENITEKLTEARDLKSKQASSKSQELKNLLKSIQTDSTKLSDNIRTFIRKYGNNEPVGTDDSEKTDIEIKKNQTDETKLHVWEQIKDFETNLRKLLTETNITLPKNTTKPSPDNDKIKRSRRAADEESDRNAYLDTFRQKWVDKEMAVYCDKYNQPDLSQEP